MTKGPAFWKINMKILSPVLWPVGPVFKGQLDTVKYIPKVLIILFSIIDSLQITGQVQQ